MYENQMLMEVSNQIMPKFNDGKYFFEDLKCKKKKASLHISGVKASSTTYANITPRHSHFV